MQMRKILELLRRLPQRCMLLCVAVFSFSWIGLALPGYRLSKYMILLRPALIAAAIASAALILFFLFERGQSITISPSRKIAIKVSAIFFLILISAAIFIAATGIGVSQRDDYWYGAGVPVLGLQILFALSMGALIAWIESQWKIESVRKVDALIFILIWAIAAWLWAREPLRSNYFFPDTGVNDLYPYSDSATWDIGSQFALIGQGLFNGGYFDRVLYSAFLTYLHLFVGQNTEQLMVAQAAVYSIFPALVYLIGRELHGRALGVSAGFLILLRGVNSISAAAWIDLASPKMMMTDFPTAIGVALVTLFVLKWLKRPAHGAWAIGAGGAIGMTLMLRTHVLLLLPFLIIYMFVAVRPRWKYGALGALLLIVGMVAATMPWDIRNELNGKPMFYIYYYRIESILHARYGVEQDTYIPPAPSANPVTSVSLSADTRLASQVLFKPQNAAASSPRILDRLYPIANNFFHNLVTSILFLPTSFTLDDLQTTIKTSAPYWRQDWAGEDVNGSNIFFIVVNLALVSLGVAAAWNRNKFVGFLPIVIFFAYLLSNALALTSGGRYIVPVDWIVCVYYILGVLQLALWGLRFMNVPVFVEAAQSECIAPPMPQYFKILTSLAIVFAIGSLIPIAEMPFEKLYQKRKPVPTLVMLEQKGWLKKADLNFFELKKFMNNPRARIVEGRMLYPRYYRAKKGEAKQNYPYLTLNYSRLAFIAIGPYGRGGVTNVIVANEKRLAFAPQAADVIVIGCQDKSFVDALVVFVLTEPGSAYARLPRVTLLCPLPTP